MGCHCSSWQGQDHSSCERVGHVARICGTCLLPCSANRPSAPHMYIFNPRKCSGRMGIPLGWDAQPQLHWQVECPQTPTPSTFLAQQRYHGMAPATAIQPGCTSSSPLLSGGRGGGWLTGLKQRCSQCEEGTRHPPPKSHSLPTPTPFPSLASRLTLAFHSPQVL